MFRKTEVQLELLEEQEMHNERAKLNASEDIKLQRIKKIATERNLSFNTAQYIEHLESANLQYQRLNTEWVNKDVQSKLKLVRKDNKIQQQNIIIEELQHKIHILEAQLTRVSFEGFKKETYHSDELQPITPSKSGFFEPKKKTHPIKALWRKICRN